jgi:hypothetical protein
MYDEEPVIWRRVSKELLLPSIPFEVHQLLFDSTFASWEVQSKGPRPVWIPTLASAQDTNLAQFMVRFWGHDPLWDTQASGNPLMDWPLLQKISYDNPEAFWPAFFDHIGVSRGFSRPYSCVLDRSGKNGGHWLPGARTNIARLALYGDGTNRDPDAPAVVFARESDPHSDVTTWSLRELRARSSSVAWGIRALGLKPGDGVGVAVPFTAESIAVYLGIVLAGCAVVSIADSFSAQEISTRLGIARAQCCFTSDNVLRAGKALPMYERVAAGAEACTVVCMGAEYARARVLKASLRPEDLTYDQFLERARACAYSSKGIFQPETVMQRRFIPYEQLPYERAHPILGFVRGKVKRNTEKHARSQNV